MKKLIGVLAAAAVLSCAVSGLAFGEVSFPADEPAAEDGYETEYASPDEFTFSQDPGDWTAVIVKQDYESRVFVRLYGKAREGATPTGAFAGVSGIDSPRAWIGDANGGAEGEGGYVIIEGTAQSEEAARDARVNWVAYDDQGQTLIQVFHPDPVTVREMSGGAEDQPKGSGCDSGLGLAASVAVAALAVVRYAGKRAARDIPMPAAHQAE